MVTNSGLLTHSRYILFVRKNALQVLIPKFGLEGTIYLSGKKNSTSTIQFVYNEEEHTQQHKNLIFRAFDPVTIRLSLDTSNVQHEKLVFELVKPFIPGFSVDPLPEQMIVDEAETSISDPKPNKRKSKEHSKKEAPLPDSTNLKKGKKNKKQK